MQIATRLCPLGVGFKLQLLSVQGEGQAAGEQHGSGASVPAAILPVTHQGEAPAGELHADLVAAAGVEPHMHQSGVGI